ncbi:MAG: hypothetical protein JO086_06390 [Acidimicrobiia bacterium]|nr:hypothetical protein [Acidimicrobiia bacterium]
MRVVFTCIPQTGHITPLMPLAEALAAQGDDVVVASGPDAEPAATKRGLSFRQVAPAFGEWFEALRRRTRGVPGDGLAPERVEGYFLPRLFGEVGMALMVDNLVEVCRELAPDLLIFDPLLFAAPLAGDVASVPVAQHTVGPLTDPAVLALVADAVSPIWREFGRDVPPSAGVYNGTTLTICPPSLDRAATSLAGARQLRSTALPTSSAQPLTVELPRRGDPVVYVTLGTFSNNPDVFRLILDALGDEPVNVVATIGTDNDPQQLSPFPANAVVERFIPQAELLPHCAAAIHHAGAGTAFGILAHGLPSVALPQSADNFTIAGRLAVAEASITVMPGDVTGEALVTALRRVLSEPVYGSASDRVAAEIAAMPSPAEVAAALRAEHG